MRELEAMTDALTDLKSGTIIKVVDVTANGILIVDQTRKPIEPTQVMKNNALEKGESHLLNN